MATVRTDRRTERTRAALMAAFVDLILTREYAEITVEDIVKRANIGRSTFYVHYVGKEDILKQSMAHPSNPLANIVGSNLAPQTLMPILKHFREQRGLNRMFLSSPIRPIWVSCLAEMIEPRLAALSRKIHAQPTLPLALIAAQLAEAQLGLIAHWLMGRAPCRPEAVAEALIASTNANVSALLRVRS